MAKKKTKTQNDGSLVNEVDKILDGGPTKTKVRAARGLDAEPAPSVGRLDGEGRTKGKTIIIPRTERRRVDLAVRAMPGSSLVVHEWSDKALKQMLGEQMGFDFPREEKDPFGAYLDSLVWSRADGMLAMKSVPFKAAMISAVRHVERVNKTDLMHAVHVLGDHSPLWGRPMNRLDPVRVGPWNNRVADLRFRGEYLDWMAVLTIQFDPDVIDLDTVTRLLSRAGSVGVGEWRPERGGNHGLFEVVAGDAKEVEKIKAQLGRYRKSDLTPENSGTTEILESIGIETLRAMRDAKRANGVSIAAGVTAAGA